MNTMPLDYPENSYGVLVMVRFCIAQTQVFCQALSHWLRAQLSWEQGSIETDPIFEYHCQKSGSFTLAGYERLSFRGYYASREKSPLIGHPEVFDWEVICQLELIYHNGEACSQQ